MITFKNPNPILILFVLVLIVTALYVVPLLVIWSLNQLFTVTIAYTFWNWLAIVILIIVFTKVPASN